MRKKTLAVLLAAIMAVGTPASTALCSEADASIVIAASDTDTLAASVTDVSETDDSSEMTVASVETSAEEASEVSDASETSEASEESAAAADVSGDEAVIIEDDSAVMAAAESEDASSASGDSSEDSEDMIADSEEDSDAGEADDSDADDGISIASIEELDGIATTSETAEVGDYTYTISDGVAVISSYNGTDTSITVPTSMTYDGQTYRISTISSGAFSGNTTLQSVTIPDGISQIGTSAFKNCANLSYVKIEGNLGDITSNSISTSSNSSKNYKNNSVFYNAGTNAESLTVEFGGNATYVPAYLFATASSSTDGLYAHVTKVILSDSVTEIGSYAFYNCYDLKELQMGSGLLTIGSSAFCNCSSLETINWGSSLTTIGSSAFANDTALKTLNLPERLTYIKSSAFSGCTGLTSIVLPASTSSVETCAFKNCTSLTSITVNGDIGDITSNSVSTSSNSSKNYKNNSVFYNAGANADSLTVTFGGSATYVPAYFFATASSQSDNVYAHVTKVVLSDSIKCVSSYAFHDCYDLTTVEMGSGMTAVYSYAFYNCSGLTTIKWGSNLTTVDSHAFENCTGLTSLNLPSKTTYVNSCAFMGCTGLTSIVLPASTTSVGTCAFKNCTFVNSITINGNIGDITSNAASTSSNSSKNYSNNSVFYNVGANADSLTVTFGSGVTTVPAYLFATASSQSDSLYAHVTSVVFADTVTSIGAYAFYNCYDLASVTMSKGIESIGAYAFANNSFTSLTIDSSAPSVGENAFSGMTLTIIYPSGNSTWTSDVLADYGGSISWAAKFMTASEAVVSTIENVGSAIKLTWGSISGASGYYVYRKTNTTGYSRISEITNASTVSYTDSAVTSGTTYTYYVQAYNGSMTTSYSEVSLLFLAEGTISSLTNKTNGVQIKWNLVPGATGYYIYRKTSSGDFEQITAVESASTLKYTDTSVKSNNGTTYIYKVVPYSGSTVGTGASSTTVRLKTVKISSAKRSSSTKATIKWKKASKVTGYEIQYSTNKNFKNGNKTVKAKSAKTVKKVLKKLKANKTYYVRLRTYKTVGGTTYYSAWCTKKKLAAK